MEITFGITLGCEAELESLSAALMKQIPPRGPAPRRQPPVPLQLLRTRLPYVWMRQVLGASGPPGALPPSWRGDALVLIELCGPTGGRSSGSPSSRDGTEGPRGCSGLPSSGFLMEGAARPRGAP